VTKPAVAELKKRCIIADGPVGADLPLGQRRRAIYLPCCTTKVASRSR